MTQFANSLDPDFQRIRDRLGVPQEFPAPTLAEAEAATTLKLQANARYIDLTAIPFVTLDPPGSRDLDQAFFMERAAGSYRVQYAIADVGHFVAPGEALEREAWRRGETLYSPDVKTPLYPSVLSEGGASLLPEEQRPAVVFTFALNADAEVVSLDIARALVISRAQLNYPQVSDHLANEQRQVGSGPLNGQEWTEALSLLKEVGVKRQRIEAGRGGVSLRIPAQQVERWSTAVAGYRLAFESASEVEEWNAQISLMTGMGAARVMIAHGMGLLRTLDPPRRDRVRSLRLTAHALGVAWPEGMDYDDFVRGLDPHDPMQAVMLHQAARVTGGARYMAFAGDPPHQAIHSAIAAPYAHATAPLRRLADRYVLDLLVALTSGESPSKDLLAALDALPQVMAESDNLAHQLESAIVDCVEARLMQPRVGEVFTAVVIALRVDGVVVQITDPPIRTLVPAAVFALAGMKSKEKPASLATSISEDDAVLTIGSTQIHLGQTISLRLEAATPSTGSLRFSLA